jgi:hypothetical protein
VQGNLIPIIAPLEDVLDRRSVPLPAASRLHPARIQGIGNV